ncbi:MAG: ABC transporter ATP-binding protein [Spirochaetaceae bacterium]|jgi:ABC-type nitrate/sulfonate/bicarbonate transport system ATPase subunit|nr:ABC transporter ATP-binding protein [Spirochaetaceae bacterium]
MADNFSITLDSVSFSFGDNKIIDNMALALEETPAVILGPSGCGKTTLLRLIAGLLKPQSGAVRFGGNPGDFNEVVWKLQFPNDKRLKQQNAEHFARPVRQATGLSNRSNVAVVFQEPRLLPHLSVMENITLPARKHLAPDALRQKALRLLALTGLQNEAGRYPDELSGGQKQRVSIARAFCYPAPLLLMDEPFQSLDLPLRFSLLETLKNLLAVENRFVAAVTHDPREAVIMGKRILVLGKTGRIVLDTINDRRDPSLLEQEIVRSLTGPDAKHA